MPLPLVSHRLNGGKIGDRHNFLSHALVMRRCKLCAVLPVNLVAVVLRRVVAGGDVDAGDAAKLADGKGKLRRRAQRLEPVRLMPFAASVSAASSANSGDI